MFFFLFDLGFTYLSRIFHLYRADRFRGRKPENTGKKKKQNKTKKQKTKKKKKKHKKKKHLTICLFYVFFASFQNLINDI